MELIPVYYTKEWYFEGFKFVTKIILRYGYSNGGTIANKNIIHKISITTESEYIITKNISDYGSFESNTTDAEFLKILNNLEDHAKKWAIAKREVKSEIEVYLKNNSYKKEDYF